MDQLKLQLIQEVLHTHDKDSLRTALQVLRLGNKGKASAQQPQPSRGLPDLLGGGEPPADEDTRGLQDDIDEVFNP